MSSFDLRRLRYFVAVAELGSVTRAASELHIAQPALSHQIHQLEDELGVQLFARGPQGVTLTETGRLLADESRVILGDIRALRGRLKDHLRDDPEGIVVIGVSQTIGFAIAVPLLERAAQSLPRVQVQIREVMSADIPALIRSESIDFAISYAVPSGYGVQSINIFSEDMYLLGTHALAEARIGVAYRGAELPFAALEGLSLYLSARLNNFRDALEHIAKSSKVDLNVVAEVDSVTLRKEIALSGRGFTIVSGVTIRDEMKRPDVYVARIVDPPIRRRVCFVTRSGGALSRASQQLALIATDGMEAAAAGGLWTSTAHLTELRQSLETKGPTANPKG